MKYCVHCGTAIDEQANYCRACGGKQETAFVSAAEGVWAAAPADPPENETVQPSFVPPAAPNPPTVQSEPQANYGYDGAGWQQPTPAQPGIPQKKKSNGLAIAGFVVALCSVLFLAVPLMGVFVSLVALGLSVAGMLVARQKNGADGMAVAGMVISIIFCLTSVYYMIRYWTLF